MNLPNNDDLPWEEDTSMMHPRNPEANEISCWTNNLDTQIVPATPSTTYPQP